MQALCVKCQAEYQVRKLGVTVIETSGNPPRPARLWTADLLACPICNSEIVTHFSYEPMMESHEAGFSARLKETRNAHAYTLHNPEFLAMRVQSNTVEVRPYVNH